MHIKGILGIWNWQSIIRKYFDMGRYCRNWKISLTVVQTNTKAIQLYKRYGFVEEGLLIKDRIHKDGSYYNTVMMGRVLHK